MIDERMHIVITGEKGTITANGDVIVCGE